jgi:hypothetical protein
VRLLLDEQISPEVGAQVRSKRAGCWVYSVYEWRNGEFGGSNDDLLLAAAARESLTLVTYDQKTIVPLLSVLGAFGDEHSGVVFIDNHSIPSQDFGGLVSALLLLLTDAGDWDWTNRMHFLRPA